MYCFIRKYCIFALQNKTDMPNFQQTTVVLSNTEYFELLSDAIALRSSIAIGEQDKYLDIILQKEYLSKETKDAILNRVATLQKNMATLNGLLNPDDLPY